MALVEPPRRILIDWDYAAHGVWWILAGEEMRAPARSRGPSGVPVPAARGPRLRDMLSVELRDALKEWNVAGETVDRHGGRDADGGEAARAAFWARGAALAERTQDELGDGFEVLYQTPAGAWRWVRRPSRWD